MVRLANKDEMEVTLYSKTAVSALVETKLITPVKTVPISVSSGTRTQSETDVLSSIARAGK